MTGARQTIAVILTLARSNKTLYIVEPARFGQGRKEARYICTKFSKDLVGTCWLSLFRDIYPFFFYEIEIYVVHLMQNLIYILRRVNGHEILLLQLAVWRRVLIV
jgi:hypothetical protein